MREFFHYSVVFGSWAAVMVKHFDTKHFSSFSAAPINERLEFIPLFLSSNGKSCRVFKRTKEYSQKNKGSVVDEQMQNKKSKRKNPQKAVCSKLRTSDA